MLTIDQTQTGHSKGQRIVVTGANGFIGKRVIARLQARGFSDVVCLTRPSPAVGATTHSESGCARPAEWIQGNLLSPEDCERITRDATIVLHLAAGRGEKSYPDAYLNSVVTTRNLLEACKRNGCLQRFVNVSSFAVYSNCRKPHGSLLDEHAPVEPKPAQRGQAYCYAKVRQDELVIDYGRKHQLPYVLLRPGWVYGPGNEAIHPRVGIGTFGLFLHLGGANTLPLSYVDNCAEAIVLAGITPGVNGEVFNVVDDELPTSRQFLRAYKRQAKRFRSIYLPHLLSYLGCWLWENYCQWSEEQLPPVFGRGMWYSNWQRTTYTNQKIKERLGWRQVVPTAEGLRRYFEACRERPDHA